MTLADLYESTCRWRGALDLFVDERERFSARDAWQASRAFASGLAASGLAKGEVVAFLCKPSARHAVSWFGVPLAGGVACSMHVRETAARLGETIAWLGATWLVHDGDLAGLAEEALSIAAHEHAHAARAVSLADDAADDSRRGTDHASSVTSWRAMCAVGDADALRIAIEPDDLAAIVLSSGSTGRPKGVMHTHRTLVENARAGQMLYGTVGLHDATLIVMQPSFAAWMNVVIPFVGGRAKVAFASTFTPEGFARALQDERITMAPAVPTMWRMMFAADLDRFDLSSVKIVSISGEPPARADLERIYERVCRDISSFYASSEIGTGGALLATVADTLGRARDGRVLGPGKPQTTGRPLAGADVRIIDPAGGFDDVLPAGEIGEILVRGPSTAIGYWKDEPLTRARFRDGWWRSGDVGRIDADGDVFVLGRTDNAINTGGMKVYGEEVERVLLGHPSIQQVAVIGVADAQWGQRIEAHVVLRAGAPSVDAAALDAFCRASRELAAFKVPKAFHFVATLPTGPTGKLYRRALRGD